MVLSIVVGRRCCCCCCEESLKVELYRCSTQEQSSTHLKQKARHLLFVSFRRAIQVQVFFPLLLLSVHLHTRRQVQHVDAASRLASFFSCVCLLVFLTVPRLDAVFVKKRKKKGIHFTLKVYTCCRLDLHLAVKLVCKLVVMNLAVFVCV